MDPLTGTLDVTRWRLSGLPAAVAGLLVSALLLAAGAAGLQPLRWWDGAFPAIGSPAARDTQLQSFGGLPLAFVENRGQWPEAARFVARQGPMTATFERHAIRVGVGGDDPAWVALSFEGASRGSAIIGEGTQEGRYNYFVGDDPVRWRSGVPAYGSLLYQGLYPGIDVRVRAGSGTAGEPLAYDVLAAPGAGIEQVVIRAAGASGLTIAEDGALLVHVGDQTLRQAPPVSWEVLPGGQRRPIDSAFRVIGARRYGFEVPGRDPSLPLVIDPGLDWATYLGGSGDESIEGLALAANGDVVVAGQTASPDFPGTGGNLVPVGWTPYVARLDASGSQLVYATFFGGSRNHSVRGLSLDASDQPVVVGDTTSPDFPTTEGAYLRTGGDQFAAQYDGYVIKFDAAGEDLVFGTYLAGEPGEGTVDPRVVGHEPDGSVIVVGNTNSSSFPLTSGGYPGQPGLFVTRFDPAGSDVTYSAFLHPADVFAMAVDAQGFVTLTGQTSSSTFPTTPDAFQPAFQGGAIARDAFVARLKLDGEGTADLRYSTYFGGAEHIEAGNGIAVDPGDPEFVTVSGFTRSGDFPTTPGAVQREHFAPGQSSMAFVTRFHFPSAGAGSLVWSTLYGGPGNQSASGVAVDGTGAAIIAGTTAVNNPPTTERAYDRIPGDGFGLSGHDGKVDGYVARLSADGSQVLYSTLLGGGDVDSVQHLAFAGGTSVVVAGLTRSTNFPVTPGAFDTVYAADGMPSGNSAPGTLADDVFVARLTLEPEPNADTTPPPAPEPLGPPDGAAFGYPARDLTFDWSDVTDPSGIAAYHLQLSPNAEFRNDFASELNGWWEVWVPTSEAVVTVGHSGTFWWRVRALDGANNLGSWSPVRSVVVASSTPAQVTLSGPPDGGRFAPGDVTFWWQEAAGAGTYQLQVDTSSDFTSSDRITVSNIGGTQHTLSITDRDRYYWRVRGMSQVTAGPWSAVWGFRIRNGEPSAPSPPGGGGEPGGPATAVTEVTMDPDWFIHIDGTAQGTVTLDGAAPAGGAVVTLASNYPDRLAVPSSVTVAEGSSSATFTATGLAPALAFITARYGGVTTGTSLAVMGPLPRTLGGLSVSTSTPLGGETVTGTVSLANGWLAGPGGALIALGSTDPGLASVPATVTIPEGASSATFSITTGPVTEAMDVTVLASRSMTHRQTLQLLPAGGLASLSIDPKTVTGGETSQGTVTLAGAAPAGGAVVELASHNTSVATVPASVTVPAGASSATFTISTSEVCCQGHWSEITASYGGITKWETINVNPGSGGGGGGGGGGGSDSVTITRAEYDTGKGRLRIEATSTSSNATLRAYVTSTDELIGTLSNDGGGDYSLRIENWPSNPVNVTVRSSQGGEASRNVTT